MSKKIRLKSFSQYHKQPTSAHSLDVYWGGHRQKESGGSTPRGSCEERFPGFNQLPLTKWVAREFVGMA